ncbi:hypothetical protein RRG08_014038 [Elysia crispata]|uniref:Uncharacterized protein n=1 Tax=Elysia crispata TaxID=231223 RepID=A0AAE1DQE3_9GAST|nr:hypothetical protein RRG08_014038 [Elysia crispata]
MGKDQELLDACRKGNLAAAEKLLSAKLAAKGKGPKATGTSSGGAFSLIKSISSLKGANVNCVDHSGDTPLHLAALNGFLDIVLLLLDCDANPTILDTQDCSPLHLAAWGGHTEICSHLLLSTEGQALLNLQTRDGNTALHFAAHHGYINVLSLLLQKGGDPVIRNLEDKSPLDLAAQYDRMDIVTQLVTSHPELLTQRSVQNTPLHLASRLGHRSVVRYLLDSGFPIDAKTDKGSALHEAANFCKLDVIRLLLERGIDISVKSQTGCTAEDILRSIPSRAAEEALNILKTHIYHQRTPDSDGEKSIAGDTAPEILVPDSQQRTAFQTDAQTSHNVISSSVQPKNELFKSLPTSTEGSTAPPAIPPRLSVRLIDRKDGPPHPGLAPLTVPSNSETNSHLLADSPGEEDKSRHNISPSSKSPLEQPKKPPRRKPLSFRRNDQDAPFSGQPDPTANEIQYSASGKKNYVNLDPEVERAAVEAKFENKHKELQSVEDNSLTMSAAATSTTDKPQASMVLSSEDNDNNNGQADLRGSRSEEGNAVLEQESEGSRDSERIKSANENFARLSQSIPIKGDKIEADVTEAGSSPPTSLDITTAPRVSASPPTLTPRHQPPTPDCPPPSPSTALLNIQRQILPGENRRSKDMETITDSSLTEKEAQPTEQQGATSSSEVPVAAATLPRLAPKKKPTPLPRKSSLSSDTRDLPRTRSGSAVEASIVSMEGYSGARPASSIVPGRTTRDPADSQAPQQQTEAKKKASQAEQVDVESERQASVASSSADTKVKSVGGDKTGDTMNLEDFDNEPVQMRRSLSAENNPSSWDEHVFADLNISLSKSSVAFLAARRKRAMRHPTISLYCETRDIRLSHCIVRHEKSDYLIVIATTINVSVRSLPARAVLTQSLPITEACERVHGNPCLAHRSPAPTGLHSA